MRPHNFPGLLASVIDIIIVILVDFKFIFGSIEKYAFSCCLTSSRNILRDDIPSALLTYIFSFGASCSPEAGEVVLPIYYSYYLWLTSKNLLISFTSVFKGV